MKGFISETDWNIYVHNVLLNIAWWVHDVSILNKEAGEISYFSYCQLIKSH